MPEDVWRFIIQAVPLYWLKGAWLFSLELLRSDDNSNGSVRERERERERGKKSEEQMKRNKRREKKRAKMLMKRNTRETSWWNETHRERERERDGKRRERKYPTPRGKQRERDRKTETGNKTVEYWFRCQQPGTVPASTLNRRFWTQTIGPNIDAT